MSQASGATGRPLTDVLAELKEVPGWLSDNQAAALHQLAAEVASGGRIVEIGSFRGRSTIVLAQAADPSVEVIAIDPHGGGDRGPREIESDQTRGEEDFQAFHANLARAGVAGHVRHVRLASIQALGEVSGRIDLLYVDGAHRYGPALSDISDWGSRVGPGGSLLIHDAFSSVGVTLAILTRLLLARDFIYVGRVRSLAQYRRAEGPIPAGQRLKSAARQVAELPWFMRNVLIKLALVTGLGGLAVRLGHRAGDEWPY